MIIISYSGKVVTYRAHEELGDSFKEDDMRRLNAVEPTDQMFADTAA